MPFGHFFLCVHLWVVSITKTRFTIYIYFSSPIFSLHHVYIGAIFPCSSMCICTIIFSGCLVFHSIVLVTNLWPLNIRLFQIFHLYKETTVSTPVCIPFHICLNISLGYIPRNEFFSLKIYTCLRILNTLPNFVLESFSLLSSI